LKAAEMEENCWKMAYKKIVGLLNENLTVTLINFSALTHNYTNVHAYMAKFRDF
jgi:hypothetical protein